MHLCWCGVSHSNACIREVITRASSDSFGNQTRRYIPVVITRTSSGDPRTAWPSSDTWTRYSPATWTRVTRETRERCLAREGHLGQG